MVPGDGEEARAAVEVAEAWVAEGLAAGWRGSCQIPASSVVVEEEEDSWEVEAEVGFSDDEGVHEDVWIWTCDAEWNGSADSVVRRQW